MLQCIYKRENKQNFTSCSWFGKYQSYVLNKKEDERKVAREELLEAILSSVFF